MTRSRNVLYVSHTGLWGGGAEIVLEQMMKAARRAGYVPHLLCPTGELANRLAPLSATITHVQLPQLQRTMHPRGGRLLARWLVAMIRIFLAVKRTDAAIVHVNSGVAALSACFPVRITGRPFVWHQHDIVPYRWINHVILGACGRLASAIIPCSEAVATSLIRLGAPKDRIHVLYNCVRQEFLDVRPDRSTSRREFGLPREGTVFAVVGRLVPRKGQDVFIKALTRLAAQGLDVYGILLGDVPVDPSASVEYNRYRQKLELLAQNPVLHSRVSFLGHRDDVQVVLAASDAMVLPSFAEPFPLAVLEAFAARIPVIASDAGGHPEAIEDGVTGLLVPVGDEVLLARAMELLSQDSELRSALACRAYERVVTNYSEQSLAPRLHAIYATVDRVLQAELIARAGSDAGSG